MPLGCDEQWLDLFDLQHRWRDFPHARGIYPVRFGQVSKLAVVLRHPATATLHGKSCLLQVLAECPSRRVDCSGIFEWRFGLGLDLLAEIGFLCQEYGNILGALAL